MTPPRMCEDCGRKPQGYHGRKQCYDCKPGSKGRPRPCRRCGSTGNYWAAHLCKRCHQYAPQQLESCRDCQAWGVSRTYKWLCRGCGGWRLTYPGTRPCVSCGDERSVNDQNVCRLCWCQAKFIQPRLKRRQRGLFDVVAANFHGQQLFFANMGSSLSGHRPPPVADRLKQPLLEGFERQRKRNRQARQLDLFAPEPIRDCARLYGFPDPPDFRLARTLDTLACEHGARYGWIDRRTYLARVSIRVLLGMREATGTPIRASEVAQLIAHGLQARAVLAILDDAGMLDDDRPATIETWFQDHIRDLPDPMTGELQTWFDVLHQGSTTSPRSRPRTASTIKCRLSWALPTLRSWVLAGHDSLREISREDIVAVLPAAGTPRATLGNGLRSIFGTLKAHKVIFVNPMSRIQVGNFTRSIPLPADMDQLRGALNSPDPPGAAMAALMIFHGLRPAELRGLQLTDVRDGRLHLADRVQPLADPVKSRLASYLDYRHRRWPDSINPHFFVHVRSAGSTKPTQTSWVNDHLGMSAQAIRQDRMVDEAQATGGDLRRMADFFGVTVDTAAHYASMLNHPALTDGSTDDIDTGSRTQGPV